MISILFFILAAICNAIIDVTQFHFYDSIFNGRLFGYKFNSNWYNGLLSWKNKYEQNNPYFGRKKIKKGILKGVFIPVQITDAFHFFKMLMIIFLAIAVISFDVSILKIISNSFIKYSTLLIIYGLCWNVPFSYFYTKILRK